MEKTKQYAAGRFLTASDRAALKQERLQRIRRRKQKKLLSLVGLIAGNGLLQYMICGGSINPNYGALFCTLVSVYFGCQLKGE